MARLTRYFEIYRTAERAAALQPEAQARGMSVAALARERAKFAMNSSGLTAALPWLSVVEWERSKQLLISYLNGRL